MVANGIMIGLHPEQIRDMLTKDTWIVFKGWQDAHARDDAEVSIMDAEQYRKLVEQVDGN